MKFTYQKRAGNSHFLIVFFHWARITIFSGYEVQDPHIILTYQDCWRDYLQYYYAYYCLHYFSLRSYHCCYQHRHLGDAALLQ